MSGGPWEDFARAAPSAAPAPEAGPWVDFSAKTEAPAPARAPMGAGEAALRGAEAGLTFGFGDEARGVAAASNFEQSAPSWLKDTVARYSPLVAAGRLLEGTTNLIRGDAGAKERYGAAVDENRAAQAQAREEQPVAAIGGQILGSVPAAVAGGGLVSAAATLPMRMLGQAGVGAAMGGLQGAGEGEGAEGRAFGALHGAEIGGALGGAGEAIAAGAGRLYGSVFGGAKQAAPGVVPAERIAAADEFGIPLTRGQATGNIGQQAYEEAARNQARGGPAASKVQAFDARQAEAIQAARGRVAEGLGGEAVLPPAMGEAVQDALRQRATELRNSADMAYTVAGAKGATVELGEVANLGRRVASDLEAGGIVVNPQYGGYPGAQAALNIMRRVSGFEGAPEGAVAQSLSGLDAARKALGGVKPANAEDMRAITSIRKSFDGWLDDAMDRSLFSGDSTALADLKAGRELWSQYKGLTTAKPGDKVPALITKMQETDVTGEQAANWLLGTASADQAGRAAAVAMRLKGVLGKESPEWEGLRQAAYTKMMEPTRGAGGNQAVSSSMLDFLGGQGAPLAKALFSPEEIGQMRRLATVIKSTVTDPKAANPSKSGYEVARLLGSNAGMAATTTAGGAYAAYTTGDPKYLAIAALPLLKNVASLSKGVAATKAEPSAVGRVIGQAARVPLLAVPGAVQGY